MTTLRPCSLAIARSRRMISCPIFESRLAVGSSARRMDGSFTSARAMATRCFSPPESFSGRKSRRSFKPSCVSRCRAMRRAVPFFWPAKDATKATFSTAVRAESRLKSWKMKPNSCRRMRGNRSSRNSLIGLPLRRIVPSVGLSSAPSIKSRVVFPDPEGPMIRTTSPGSIASDTSRTAVTSVDPEPNRLVTLLICSVRLPISLSSKDHCRIEVAHLTDRQQRRRAGEDHGSHRRLGDRRQTDRQAQVGRQSRNEGGEHQGEAYPDRQPQPDADQGLNRHAGVEIAISRAQRLHHAVLAPSQQGGGVDRQAHHRQSDQEPDGVHDADQVGAHVPHDTALLRGELLAGLYRHTIDFALDPTGHVARGGARRHADEKEADDTRVAPQLAEVVAVNEGDRIGEARRSARQAYDLEGSPHDFYLPAQPHARPPGEPLIDYPPTATPFVA